MSTNPQNALDLCRTLLAFTTPGTAVAVPHAALAQIVDLASGAGPVGVPAGNVEMLQELYDVAALARRYNRAPATVRQWFHDGLFGPPAERLFRGRGYVASAEAVREFEAGSSVKERSAGTHGAQEDGPPTVDGLTGPPAQSRSVRTARPPEHRTRSGLGGKILAAGRRPSDGTRRSA
ncbi:MAG: hypothetical protein JWM27_3845 [Gemmatimonadetes bacterium]|nr:hypothetical protein [Gemmatimonadota bacterium]